MKQKRVTKDFEVINNSEDKKINILVMGTSGCGKSTLINAILEDEQASTCSGNRITNEIKVYENESLPFRMIDTVGFEYNLFKQMKIKYDLDRWSKGAIKNRQTSNLIHAIWFCIDGTVKRIEDEVMRYIYDVSKTWKHVPIIVVFTKSYSRTEIDENRAMFRTALDHFKKAKELNIKAVVPVVAKSYPIDDTNVIPSFGLDDLIEKTNAIIPEAKQISKGAIREIDIRMKRNMAYGILSVSTVSAVAIGAIPIPIQDATLLVPLQGGMLKSIAKTFNIDDKSVENEIINTILQVGATTMIAKNVLNLLKANPAINIGVDILNAAVAGTITFIAGEIEIIALEGVYTDKIDVSKIDMSKQIKEMFKDKLPAIVEILNESIDKESGSLSKEKLMDIFKVLIKKNK